MRALLFFACAVALAVAAAAGAGGPATKNGRIVFASGKPYRTDVVTLDVRTGRERTVKGAANAEAPVPSPDGEWVAYQLRNPARPSFNAPIWVARLDGKRRRLVAHGQDQAWSPDSRKLVYTDCFGPAESCQPRLLITGRAGRGRHVVYAGTAQVPRWSPDGRWIAFAQTGDPQGSVLCVVRLHGAGFHAVAQGIADPYGYDWSPNSSRLVFTRYRRGEPGADLYTAPVGPGPETRLSDDPDDKFRPRWSPDGGSIAYSASDSTTSTVMLASASGGSPHAVANGSWPVWSRDGRLAFWTQSGDIELAHPGGPARLISLGIGAVRWNLNWILRRNALLLTRQAYDNESRLFSVSPRGADARRVGPRGLVGVDPAWSPDGSRLAFVEVHADGSRNLAVLSADGRVQPLTTNRYGWDSQPTWSPDGRRIAFVRARSFQDGVLAVIRLRDGRVRSFGVKTRRWAHPAWSPDGRTIALDGLRNTEHQGIRLLDLAAGTLTDATTPFGGYDSRASLSPDGRSMAFVRSYFGGSIPGYVVMVAIGGGEPHVVARGDPFWGPPAVAWSPDGRRLAIAGVPEDGPVIGWQVVVTDFEGLPTAVPWAGRRFLTGVSWQPR